METSRNTGICKFFNAKRGFGFIKSDSDGKDIFVHFSAIVMDGYKTMNDGDVVEYDIAQSEKGPMVSNLKIIRSSR